MAQIVCITKETERAGIAEIGDIVSIHDDNVKLDGSGYVGYEIIKVENQTIDDIRAKLVVPDIQRAVKVPADKWSFMEEKEVWQNADGLWCDLVEMPKYQMTAMALTQGDKNRLANKSTMSSERDTAIGKIQEKLHLNEANNVLVADLNTEK